MMDSKVPLFNSRRRSIAIAIWTLLVVPIAFVDGQPSFGTSLVVIAIVASLSTLAQRITAQDGHPKPDWTAISVSIAVPFFWALLLATAPADLFVLGLVAVMPPANAALLRTLTPHSDLPPAATPMAEEALPVAIKSPTILAINPPDLPEEPEDEELHENELDEESEALTHWLKRSSNEDGELIEGGIRVDFLEGQRETTVHVSFCPPFAAVPEVATEDLNGDDLEIRIAALFPFGMRLSVRRPAVAVDKSKRIATASGRIGFVVTCQTARRVA